MRVTVVKTCWESERQRRKRRALPNTLKSPLMNIKKAFGSRQLCHKFANQHNVSVCAEKGSVRISIKSSFVSLMALSMEGQPIPLYTSAQLCVNHSSLILPSASSSLPLAIFISLDARSLSPSLSSFFPLLSLSFSLSVSQAAGN